MRLPAVLVLALGLTVIGCGRLTMENYAKLKVGQSYEEVTEILGNPSRCDETIGIRQCVWGDDSKGVKVGFAAGKALAFNAHNLK
jgi:hypothetical protein